MPRRVIRRRRAKKFTRNGQQDHSRLPRVRPAALLPVLLTAQKRRPDVIAVSSTNAPAGLFGFTAVGILLGRRGPRTFIWGGAMEWGLWAPENVSNVPIENSVNAF